MITPILVQKTIINPRSLFVCLIWFFTSHQQSFSYKGTGLSAWTSTKLGLMFLLKDTTQWRRWGSNPRSFGLESSTLPLSHCAPSTHVITRDLWIYKDYWHFFKMKGPSFVKVRPDYIYKEQTGHFAVKVNCNCKIVFDGQRNCTCMANVIRYQTSMEGQCLKSISVMGVYISNKVRLRRHMYGANNSFTLQQDHNSNKTTISLS